MLKLAHGIVIQWCQIGLNRFASAEAGAPDPLIDPASVTLICPVDDSSSAYFLYLFMPIIGFINFLLKKHVMRAS
jgi:hypothetical protein